MIRIPLVLLLSGLLAACGDDAVEVVPFTGVWEGESAGTMKASLDLKEAAGTVTGTATIGQDPLSLTGRVTGSYKHPAVELKITVVFMGEELNFGYSGKRVSDIRIEGHALSPGEPSVVLNLDRKA